MNRRTPRLKWGNTNENRPATRSSGATRLRTELLVAGRFSLVFPHFSLSVLRFISRSAHRRNDAMEADLSNFSSAPFFEVLHSGTPVFAVACEIRNPKPA